MIFLFNEYEIVREHCEQQTLITITTSLIRQQHITHAYTFPILISRLFAYHYIIPVIKCSNQFVPVCCYTKISQLREHCDPNI